MAGGQQGDLCRPRGAARRVRGGRRSAGLAVARDAAEELLPEILESAVKAAREGREALEDESRILALLNHTGALHASHVDVQQLLQGLTDAGTALSGARFGAFFYNVHGEAGDSYTLHTLAGVPREVFADLPMPRKTALFAPTFRGEGVIRLDDVTCHPHFGQSAPHHGLPAGHPPVRSYLAVPVVSRAGEVFGGLVFGHPQPGVFNARCERIIQALAAQAAVAIDNARLYESAQRAAEERKHLLESERAARDAAERASLAKDEFLAVLSHELRTPLSSILGWAQILRSGRRGPEELQRGLETIERNARMQVQLIEELLDMSRITSGKLKLEVESVLPAGFVEVALETIRPAAEAKGLALEARLDRDAGPIRGDAGRLQQVVWNLVNNAVKFTPAGGRIAVSLARAGEQVEIAVRDSGIGIDPRFLGQLFERFRQADSSTSRRFGGLGLGLAIVRHLVEMHGGTVHAESDGEGQGACFVVRLPVSQGDVAEDREASSAAGAEATPVSSADLSALKVLVVDDQEDGRVLAARMLGECGAQVVTAGSAAEALALVEREAPDVLVSDIGMPEVDGYELIRRVRRRGERMPAVALTAFARGEDRERILQAGYHRHVAKPVDARELVAAVASAAGRER